MKNSFVIFCFACVCNVAIAKTIWVTNSGELIKGLNAAVSGDEVILLPGQYNLGRFESRTGGTSKAPITVKATIPETVVIQASRVETFSIYNPYWVFENLTIRGTGSTHHAFHISKNADHVVIRNNKLINFHSHIKSNGKGDQFPDFGLIEGNEMRNDAIRQTSQPTSPIDVVGGYGWIVRNNVVADFGRSSAKSVSYGIFLKGNSTNGLIEQNLVICSQTHESGYRIGVSLGGGGTGKAYCEKQNCQHEHRHGVIKNNVVLNCSDAGIYLKKASDSKVFHNTLINTLGIDAQLAPTSAIVENNYVGGVIHARKGASIQRSNNITSAWGWVPYAETIAKYGVHRVSDYHVKYPSIIKQWQVELAQDGMTWLGKWIADSPMGLGRNKATDDFPNVGYGDLTPPSLSFLKTDKRISSVMKDFWGNLRGADGAFIGAVDLSISSCNVEQKIANRVVTPNDKCQIEE